MRVYIRMLRTENGRVTSQNSLCAIALYIIIVIHPRLTAGQNQYCKLSFSQVHVKESVNYMKHMCSIQLYITTTRHIAYWFILRVYSIFKSSDNYNANHSFTVRHHNAKCFLYLIPLEKFYLINPVEIQQQVYAGPLLKIPPYGKQ
jgi:hypothetical protein